VINMVYYRQRGTTLPPAVLILCLTSCRAFSKYHFFQIRWSRIVAWKELCKWFNWYGCGRKLSWYI